MIRETEAFPYSDGQKRYHTYDYAMRRLFGEKTVRITLDGGFTCPNLDGTVGTRGCIFCSARGSGDFCAARTLPLAEQFRQVRSVLERKWGKTKCLAYFQAFTGTYAPVDVLRQRYEEALALPDTAGLCIATRCDSIGDDVLALLSELNEKTELFVELGLQSVHDETLARIRRGHDYASFLHCYRRLAACGIRTTVHLIDALPGETTEQMLRTAQAVGALRPWGVKFHMLQILRGTDLAEPYEKGEVPLLSRDEYIDLVCRQIELLPPETVVCRVCADSAKDDLIAPLWTRRKFDVLNGVDKWFRMQNSHQGIRCPASGSF